jgi:hypothetical protein
MGVFHEMVEVVNRTSEQLAIMYDGQRHYLEPNYDAEGNRLPDVHNMVPKRVVPFALNQTVIMGSESFRNPGDFRSKIGIIDKKDKKRKSWHDCSFLEEAETEITRVSQEEIMEESVNDPTAKIVVKGKDARRLAQDAQMGSVPTPFDIRTN